MAELSDGRRTESGSRKHGHHELGGGTDGDKSADYWSDEGQSGEWKPDIGAAV